MKAVSTLAENLLRATGLYSDVALKRIENGLEANPGMPLIEGVLKFGGEKEALFLEKIGDVLGLEHVDVANLQPRPDVIAKLPASAVYQYNAMPIRFDGSALTVAAADPFNTAIADGLRLAAGCPVRIALAPAEEIDKAVKKFYGVGAEAVEKMLEDGRYSVDDMDGAISKIDV
ncbi:MAG: hypothetical protein E7046_15145, partial [Lentisphaerae bacterium]|nr:hypothetical protein [Lentisphaerota bacterium]